MLRPTKKLTTIDEYIKLFPKDIAVRLQTIRKIVNKVAPDAQEVISYSMPAFKLNGILVYFAAHTHHIGLYPYPSAMKKFKIDLKQYKTAKSSIQFMNNKPLPLKLIEEIVKFRVKEKRSTKSK